MTTPPRTKDTNSLQSDKLIYTNVDSDRKWAKRELEILIHTYDGPRYDVKNACAFGRPEDCAAKLRVYTDAGAHKVMADLTCPDPS